MQLKEEKTARIVPHSVEAEQAVIGSLLLDNTLWDHIVDHITAQDFYLPEHQTIFEVMAQSVAANRPFDMLTLTETLKSNQQLNEKLSESYLYELCNNTPSAGNVVAYAGIVRERSVSRQLVQAGQYIANLAYRPEGREASALLDAAEQCVFKISDLGHSKQGPVPAHQLLTKATARIDALHQGEMGVDSLATGFMDLDKLTCGLQRGDFIVIAGRPSMGKTALAMNIAESASAASEKKVVVFSLEMPGENLVMRMISSLGRIDQHHIRSGKLSERDWSRVPAMVNILSSSALFIDDTPALTPMDVRSRARRLAREQGGLDLIIVDYLQLMHLPGYKNNRTLEISEISRSLKILAKELSVPLIALSQLNRGLEQRQDKRPMMSDLRESGAIEQDADLILFVYRDEVYHEDSVDRGIAEIIVAKHRNGPIGKIRLTFMGPYLRFENYSHEEPIVCSAVAQPESPDAL